MLTKLKQSVNFIVTDIFYDTSIPMCTIFSENAFEIDKRNLRVYYSVSNISNNTLKQLVPGNRCLKKKLET